jgi:hypothetical protein
MLVLLTMAGLRLSVIRSVGCIVAELLTTQGHETHRARPFYLFAGNRGSAEHLLTIGRVLGAPPTEFSAQFTPEVLQPYLNECVD